MARASASLQPLGAVEWDSIASGIRAADALVKVAPVTPIVFRAVTPGRYFALFSGEVEAVQAATAAGARGRRARASSTTSCCRARTRVSCP